MAKILVKSHFREVSSHGRVKKANKAKMQAYNLGEAKKAAPQLAAVMPQDAISGLRKANKPKRGTVNTMGRTISRKPSLKK